MENSEEKNSANNFVANSPTGLKAVGEFLKEARQGRNLSVEDLSSSLRIGKEQLVALEEGDETSLPEKVFIKAMVRRIAEKLDLDTGYIFEELNEKKNNEPKYTPVIRKGRPRINENLNIFSMVLLSGFLGLVTSIMLLKYIQRTPSESIKSERSEISFIR